MHGNDSLVRGFGHGTTRERDNIGLLDRWNKTVKFSVARLHHEWIDKFNFGLYRYSQLLYMNLTSNLYAEELQLGPKIILVYIGTVNFFT
jgi:hypothetical protein